MRNRDNYPLHIFLFLITVLTTLVAGAELVTGKSFILRLYDPEAALQFSDLSRGIPYSFSFLLFLTFHEFGHYFTAVYHKVRCTLPFYIPVFIPILSFFNIGSFGAVIRLRQIPESTKKYFDIGIAGPLAGFVISVGLLFYGFSHLPPMEDTVYEIHPHYKEAFGHFPTEAELVAHKDYQMVINVGSNLLFEVMKRTIPDDPSQVPPPYEMMHFPFLFVGFLTLFFTGLNLLPIGQLDGGHVVYGLFGRKRAGVIARVSVVGLLMIGGTGIMRYEAFDERFYPSMEWYIAWNVWSFIVYPLFLYLVYSRLLPGAGQKGHLLFVVITLLVQTGINLLIPGIMSNPLWLIYAFITVRLIGVDHPASHEEVPLDTKRKILGWLAILIFILTFTPMPLKLAF